MLPTDTVYGVAARPDRPDALLALFELKGRAQEVPIAVLVMDLEQAEAVGAFDEKASKIASEFWPGPLTIVVPRASGFTAGLGGDGRNVGIRAPAHPAAKALLTETGPLAASSANLSGESTPPTVEKIAAIFGEAVGLYLDGGRVDAGTPSTVIGFDSEGVRLLRPGALGIDDIEKALEE